MANRSHRPRRPRSAGELADASSRSRELARSASDYPNRGENGVDEIGSFGGVPREYPHATYPPNWIRTDNVRADSVERPRAAYPYERGIAESFGFNGSGSYPYADVASAARRGRFFGRGPKGYRRSDERIREEVSDRLMVHPDIDASDMEITVTNGVVALEGVAEDRHEKRLAERIAEDVVGVDDVDNRLKVRHGFWAAVTGERATERELPARAVRETGIAAKEGGRAAAARSAARRDGEAF